MFETQYPELSAVTNKSALGGVTRKLSNGPGRIMTQIMKYEKSKRPSAHNKPKLIWCSLLLVHDVKAFEEYLNSGVTYMGEEVSREATFYRKGTGSDDDGNDGGGESGAA